MARKLMRRERFSALVAAYGPAIAAVLCPMTLADREKPTADPTIHRYCDEIAIARWRHEPTHEDRVADAESV